MSGILAPQRRRSEVVYTLAPSRPDQKVFSDIRLPDGTVIRRVDEAVHEKALDNVSRRYREHVDAV